LMLLNMSGLSVNAAFTFSADALVQTLIYFLIVYAINLVINITQVFKSNPNDLIKAAKKGDKEPKRLWLTALIGVVLLGAGYAIAIPAKVDSNIFVNFLFAVTLVVYGTHYLFKAGLLALLKILKMNGRFYYRKSNYVTISGMLHRLKKSASSLSNICIFSTMTIVTLLCTLSVMVGQSGMLQHQYPYDAVLSFNTVHYQDNGTLDEKLEELSKATGTEISEKLVFTYQKLHVTKVDNAFVKQMDTHVYIDKYAIKLITLEEYNRMVNTQETLSENEVMVFATGPNFGYDEVVLGDNRYIVKKELDSVPFRKKAIQDTFNQDYFLIVKDESVMDALASEFGSKADNDRIYTVRFQVAGELTKREALIQGIEVWSQQQPGYNSIINGIEGRQDTASMNGGLLFIGIFFSIIFTMCLVLIMYYKQVSEGYDDREGFDIMQKVGMSDGEVRATIKKQILMVFFLPLLVALLHTMAGFSMIASLLSTIYLFNTRLIILCGLIVAAFFAVIYGLSYSITSRSYYRIVKKMNDSEAASGSVTP